ncbi:MAG: protein kinase [Polyangiaceae bacterium]|nr:protein kinase [Polyangiaceae bacterium]
MSKQEAFKGVSVGEILAGKYRVERILGMGGMGVVVAATHLDLREMRAIKLIRPDAECDQSVERFLREARAVVRLRSEHVAEVYDVGRLESGAPYIVMELLEGQDLSAILKARGPLPIEEAVLYVTQACHALAEAHAAGIVHRDLKPGNLFVTRRSDGSPCIKVLDFGISKDTNPERPDPEMTGAKDLIGSPLYMSPEQMRSARKVDPRADVWALGAILYKLLTGRAPFHAPTVPEIFALTLGKQVKPPSALRPQISGELDAIILCCLDKHLKNRYRTAAELGIALMHHGPWQLPAGESASALFRPSNRRTTIPPEPVTVKPSPATTDMAEHVIVPPPPMLPAEFVVPPPPDAPNESVEMGEPMTGLARSNKINKSGRISTWGGSPSRSSIRPGWVAFAFMLSISSALIGATIVAIIARTPTIPVATASQDIPNGTREIRLPHAIVLPPPPLPVVAPSASVPGVIASATTNALPASSTSARPVEKVPAPKPRHKAPAPRQSARPPSAAETKAPMDVPAKPESSSRPPGDHFVGRD